MQQKKIPVGIFGERLQTLMDNDRVSQIELSKRTGIPQPHISRYLRGREPKRENLIVLAKFFGVSPSVLLGVDAELSSRSSGASIHPIVAVPTNKKTENSAAESKHAAELREIAAAMADLTKRLERLADGKF